MVVSGGGEPAGGHRPAGVVDYDVEPAALGDGATTFSF